MLKPLLKTVKSRDQTVPRDEPKENPDEDLCDPGNSSEPQASGGQG